MSTVSIGERIQQVRESAAKRREAMKMDETEVIGTASPGDAVRQGDLLLVCLEELPEGKPTENRQLAPGTTRGSRHILDGDCKLVNHTTPIGVNGVEVPQALIGPAFRVGEMSSATLTHPEHGDKVLPAGSIWGVVYQRAFADEARRIED